MELRIDHVHAVALDLDESISFDGKTAVIRDPSGLAIELREWAAHDGPTYPDWSPIRHDVVNLT